MLLVKMNVHGACAAVALGVIAVIGTYLYQRKKKRNTPPKTWKPVGKVSKLHIYPFKSGKRIEVKVADLTDCGIKQSATEEKNLQLCDRTFLVYGEENKQFKSARTFPSMILIEMSVHDEAHVALDAPGMRSLYVKIPSAETSTGFNIKLHDGEEIYSLDCGDEAASWISRYIHGKDSGLRIGYHDGSADHRRKLTKSYKKFTDFYNLRDESAGLYSDLTAIMLVNQASVDDLNSKIESGKTVTTEHFRPSITIDGAPPYVEDDWDWIKIGDVIMRNVKPCTRCIMTTIDPETGIRNQDREPLKTLEKYRKLKKLKDIDLEGHLTVMGVHLEVNTIGTVRLNDTVYVG